ncbi:MAG: cytochrome c biogenesis protein CcsA [Sandaracinaceae bacterium]|nr:cytochrome c biogenesis protein CcsA [Sandaracinaceae bacterium]
MIWIALGALVALGLVSVAGPIGGFVAPIGFLAIGAFVLSRKNDPPLRVGSFPVPHTILGALTIALACGSLYAIFVMAPVEVQMGIVQKIFYFHVPSAYAMYVAFVTSAVGSAVYLWKRDERWDAIAVAGAEVGLVFCLIVLITGPLWARKAWGTYWTWDPRLTTTLLAGMIYVAFNVLRGLGQAGEAEKRFASALGFLGLLLLPVIHYSVQRWRGQHPTVITRAGGGIHPDMVPALVSGFLLFTAFVALLVWSRYRIERVKQRVATLELEAAESGLLEEGS